MRPLVVVALLLLPLLALAARAATVREIRLAEHGSFTRAVIELDAPAPYSLVNNSATSRRIGIRIDGIASAPEAIRLTGEERHVRGAERRYDPARDQFELHLLTEGHVALSDFTLEGPDRIVVDIARSSAPASLSGQGAGGPWRRTIVIDPGHGGHHKGGVGKIGGRTVYEEDVTIAVAEMLERHLKADPRFDVRLTRREDVYVGLLERTERAAALNGDLFVSLHANAVEGRSAQLRARGFEIWTWNRDNNHSAAARAVARLENAEPGVKRAGSTLITRMMEDALESQALVSRRLAASVHSTFMQDSYFRRYDRGIQRARFKVLENYDMPSILVEMGFMTHPEEVKLLFSQDFRERIARYLYEGIVRYYEEHDPTFAAAPNQSRVTARAH